MRKVIKSGFIRNVCMTIDGPINQNTKEKLQEGMDGKSRMFFVCAFTFSCFQWFVVRYVFIKVFHENELNSTSLRNFD